MSRTPSILQRLISLGTAVLCVTAQVALPPRSEAGVGTTSASAGSALPPSMSAIQSFQPDLFSGRATTSIPIVVPPGRRGMQPSLTLTYSSTGGPSWVGLGWSVDLGSIERSTKNGVPHYDATDLFTCQFQGISSELVKLADGTYRAKDEGQFLQFTYPGASNNGASGWEVRDKAGTRYLFGQNLAGPSQVIDTTTTPARIFRWALEKVLDANGNTMTITYLQDHGQLYPSQIRYTEPVTGPLNQVDFVLEDQLRLPSDGQLHHPVSFRSGFAVETWKRLRQIDLSVPNGTGLQVAGRYLFEYTSSPVSPRALLTRLTHIGSDGTSSLPPTIFTYQTTPPTYTLTTTTGSTKPQLAADVNGDGRADMLVFDGTGPTWTVAFGQASGFAAPTEWLVGMGVISSIPVVGDWNGDGFADVATYTNGDWYFALSRGATASQALTPVNFGLGTPLTGDFNGDGFTDLGVWNAGTWQIALNDGTGHFPSTGRLTASSSEPGAIPLVGDCNGDGLTDLVAESSGTIHVRLATGAGFAPEQTWLGGSFGNGSSNYLTADFNGDDLTDAAYYDISSGQVIYAKSKGDTGLTALGEEPSVIGFPSLPVTFTCRVPACSLQLADFNGDGLVDPTVFNPSTGGVEIAWAHGTGPDLLVQIDNGLGATTQLQYQPSTPVTGAGQLPFVVPVVSQVTVDDGRGHALTTTYAYQQGLYDPSTREFRGFGTVTVTDPAGTTTTTTFLQDAATKGRPSAIEVRAGGNVWTKTVNTWTCSDPVSGLACTDPSAKVSFARLQQTDQQIYDGDATFQTSRTRVGYDTSWGEVTTVWQDGDPSVTTDDRRTETQYVVNASAWLVKPKLTQTFASSAGGTAIAQRRFYYDNAQLIDATPTKGHLTKEEEWLNTASTWLATTMTYDTFGNVKTVTDARGNPMTNEYDPTGTSLAKMTNALNYTRQFTYDAKTGQVTSTTDPNGQTTQTTYDPFGRVDRVYGPLTTLDLPTTRYVYALGSPISKTTVCERIQVGGTEELCTSTFTDGLGRAIQTRSPAKDSAKEVVTGTVDFNSRGLVVTQWLPYLETASVLYASPAAGLATVQYVYDPLGRITTTTQPDGTTTQTTYDDRQVTLTDANGHQTRRTVDAHGRLLTVEELDGSATPTTRYTYDALDRVVDVTDAASHHTTLTYDSLGRKTQMIDPDMGTWAYTYDAVDNLITQTDARGVKTTFAYDKLNRVTSKSYTYNGSRVITNPGTVTYTYDAAPSFPKGRLSRVDDGSGNTQFDYDALGRLLKETKTISGAPFVVQRSYDLLGRVTTLTYPDGDAVLYTYTRQGGIDQVRLQSGATTTTIASNLDYNAAGQLLKLAYGNGVTTDYQYDAKTLRLQSLRTQTASATPLQNFTYTYDAVGNVQTITDAVYGANQRFTYDARDRLTGVTGAYDETYGYDAVGNLTQHAGLTLTYGGPRPHAVTGTTGAQAINLTYDENGNVATRAGGGTTQTFTFDVENHVTKVALDPTETVTVTFKPGWNLFSLPVVPSNAAISSLLPSFSSNFEQIAKWDPATQTFTHYTGVSGFDDFTTLDYGTGYEVYCKNPAGVTGTVTGTRPTTLSKSLAAGWQLLPAVSLQHDTLAHVFKGLVVDAAKTVTADGTALTTATDVQPAQADFVQVHTAATWTPPLPSGATQFVYDGDGGRVKTLQDSGTTVHVGELVEATGGVTTKYLFAGDLRLASKSSDGTLQFYHPDHLGSTHVVTNATGQVVEHAEHRPFGALARDEGPASVPQHFTGQRQGELRGLIAFPARVYDPILGRFLQPDPLVQDPTDPQTLNRYSYCRNNPVNLVDPSGYGWFRKLIAAVVAVFVAVVVTIATDGCVPCGVAAGASTYVAISGSGTGSSSANTSSSSPPPTVSLPSAQPSALGVPESSQGPVSQPLAGPGSVRSPPPPWLRPLARLGLEVARELANWDDRTTSVAYAAENSSQSIADPIQIRVGSRPLGGIMGQLGARHRFIQIQGLPYPESIWEMGPDQQGLIATTRSPIGPVGSMRNTLDALTKSPHRILWSQPLTVSASGLAKAMAQYGRQWVGRPYNFRDHNSNYAVNTVIYAAGGQIQGDLGFSPGFPDQ